MELKRIWKNLVGLVGFRHEAKQIIECHKRLMLGFTYVQPNLLDFWWREIIKYGFHRIWELNQIIQSLQRVDTLKPCHQMWQVDYLTPLQLLRWSDLPGHGGISQGVVLTLLLFLVLVQVIKCRDNLVPDQTILPTGMAIWAVRIQQALLFPNTR